MASFGDSLRQERLRRQITLDQVAEATKIKHRFLQAIEEEALQDLPGGVFNRNFIRAYARYLGLNEEQYVEEYVRATGDSAQPGALPNPPAGARDPLISSSTLLSLLIAAIVVIVAWAGLHLYQEQQQKKQMQARVPAHPAAAMPAGESNSRPLIAPPPASPAAERPLIAGGPAHTGARPLVAAPFSSGAKAGEPSPSSSSSSSSAASAAAPMQIPPTPPGKQSLVVSAVQQAAWIQIFTDGHWRLEDTLQPGQYRVVFFRHRVKVNSGNAGATEVRINGKSVGTLGKIGLIAHFTWPANSATSGGQSGDGNGAASSGANSTSPAVSQSGDASGSGSSSGDSTPPPVQ